MIISLCFLAASYLICEEESGCFQIIHLSHSETEVRASLSSVM